MIFAVTKSMFDRLKIRRILNDRDGEIMRKLGPQFPFIFFTECVFDSGLNLLKSNQIQLSVEGY